MISDSELEQVHPYVEALATMGDAGAKQVLEHGKPGIWTPYDAERWGEKGRLKECFRNAYRKAIDHPELTYVEGYATVNGLPVHHAWLLDPDGNVQDPTWREPTDRTCGYCLGDGTLPKGDVEAGDDPDDRVTCFHCLGEGEVDYSEGDWSDSAYLGVAISTQALCEILLDSQTTCILGKPWPEGAP